MRAIQIKNISKSTWTISIIFHSPPMDGINANLFISSYTIETDESLWPVSDIR